MRLNRKWRIAISLLLCICMALSCVGSVYATAALPVVVFGALAVISAVLTATGIVATENSDFDGLCSDIYDTLSAASQIGPTVTLKVLAGVSYIQTSLAELIAGAAVKTQAYTPKEVSSFVNGQFSYRSFSATSLVVASFFPISTVSAPPSSPTWVPTSAPYGWTVTERTDSYGGIGFSLFTSFLSSDNYGYWVVYPNEYPVVIGDIVHINSRYSWETGFYTTFRYADGSVKLKAIAKSAPIYNGGSISVRFPWEVTDDLPVVSSSGVLDKINIRWLTRERELVGALSVPLSVPLDTVAGAAAQTQAQAQAGTKTDGVTNEGAGDEALSDSAVEDLVNKGQLNLAFVDFFPFCIPFDIIRGVKLLVAPAKDPVFDIPIKFPYIPQQIIHIDLTQFAGVAVFSRWFLTLAFIWGLALGTSKVIRW